jgi:hypothetical protein
METVIPLTGFLLLWMATDVCRTPSSKIDLFSGKRWLILTLLTVGSLLIGYIPQ